MEKKFSEMIRRGIEEAQAQLHRESQEAAYQQVCFGIDFEFQIRYSLFNHHCFFFLFLGWISENVAIGWKCFELVLGNPGTRNQRSKL
jgi:hypothetical protein